MAARATQPKVVRRESRIIERPRLIKLLDDTDARTILLLAPAGYGKTTLARQWAKTLNGAIWVTLTPAHTDVAWLAAEIAEAVDGTAGTTSRSIREHIRARDNPQRASRELGAVLAARLGGIDTQWLVLDDYHEITSSPEAEGLIATLERDGGARLLIASRVRPQWASGRRFVYGDVLEVGRAALAMTETEATEVLGARQSAVSFSQQAAGWPAVIGLAAAVDTTELPQGAVPNRTTPISGGGALQSSIPGAARRTVRTGTAGQPRRTDTRSVSWSTQSDSAQRGRASRFQFERHQFRTSSSPSGVPTREGAGSARRNSSRDDSCRRLHGARGVGSGACSDNAIRPRRPCRADTSCSVQTPCPERTPCHADRVRNVHSGQGTLGLSIDQPRPR